MVELELKMVDHKVVEVAVVVERMSDTTCLLLLLLQVSIAQLVLEVQVQQLEGILFLEHT